MCPYEVCAGVCLCRGGKHYTVSDDLGCFVGLSVARNLEFHFVCVYCVVGAGSPSFYLKTVLNAMACFPVKACFPTECFGLCSVVLSVSRSAVRVRYMFWWVLRAQRTPKFDTRVLGEIWMCVTSSRAWARRTICLLKIPHTHERKTKTQKQITRSNDHT